MTFSTSSVFIPSFKSFNLLAKSVPSIKSIGGAPSRCASLIASRVNDPVVINNPLSALPCRAPLKSLISLDDTEPLYFLH